MRQAGNSLSSWALVGRPVCLPVCFPCHIHVRILDPGLDALAVHEAAALAACAIPPLRRQLDATKGGDVRILAALTTPLDGALPSSAVLS